MSREYRTFSAAMDTLLRADPVAVKAEMEREQREHATERKAKGERKRGRKTAANRRPSASAPVSGEAD
jgi:hypothetical protein